MRPTSGATSWRPGVATPPVRTVLCTTPVVCVGTFRCAPPHPLFRDSGPIANHIFVFPRMTVSIRHDGSRPFVTDRNLVTFYNRDQVYVRDAIDPAGDRSDWFAVAPDVITEVMARFDPGVEERPDRPFALPFGPASARTYLRQRTLVDHLLGSPPESRSDHALGLEEAVIALLHDVVAQAHGAGEGNAGRAAARPPSTRDSDLAIVETVQAHLGQHGAPVESLAQLAAVAGCSVFHLCRTFRRATGRPVHAYRNELRLRAALEALAQRHCDLTGLALELGYSSHSHFTAAFRKVFHVTPSEARRTLSARRLVAMGNHLAPAPRARS